MSCTCSSSSSSVAMCQSSLIRCLACRNSALSGWSLAERDQDKNRIRTSASRRTMRSRIEASLTLSRAQREQKRDLHVLCGQAPPTIRAFFHHRELGTRRIWKLVQVINVQPRTDQAVHHFTQTVIPEIKLEALRRVRRCV